MSRFIHRPALYEAASGSRLKRVARKASPSCFLGKRVQLIEQVWFVDHIAFLPSRMNAIKKLIHCVKHLVGAALLYQIGGCLISKRALTGKQPEPRVMRFTDIGQLVDNEFKLQQLPLSSCMGQRFPIVPPGQ